jgi:hypothetical protein
MSDNSIIIQESSKTPVPVVDTSTVIQTVQPTITVIEPVIETTAPALTITDNKTGKSVSVSSPVNQNIIISATGTAGPAGERGPIGPAGGPSGSQGPIGPTGASGSNTIQILDEGIELTTSASLINFVGSGVSTSITSSGVIVSIGGTFPFTGDAEITGSLDINGTGGDIFLIKSSSFNTMRVQESGAVTITNNAPTMFLIRDTSYAPILAVSQSGVVIFATQSIELNNPAPNGGLYFTSTSMFVGLD